MDVLARTSGEELAIFRAHVDRTLKEHASEMQQQQSSVISTQKEDFWKSRTYVTSDLSMKYSHAMGNRFFDMKRWKIRGRSVPNKKRVLNHNHIIMGHYAGIMGDLTYGLTEQMRVQLKADFDGREI